MVLLDRLSVSATLLSNFVLIPLYKIFLVYSSFDFVNSSVALCIVSYVVRDPDRLAEKATL